MVEQEVKGDCRGIQRWRFDSNLTAADGIFFWLISIFPPCWHSYLITYFSVVRLTSTSLMLQPRVFVCFVELFELLSWKITLHNRQLLLLNKFVCLLCVVGVCEPINWAEPREVYSSPESAPPKDGVWGRPVLHSSHRCSCLCLCWIRVFICLLKLLINSLLRLLACLLQM